MLFSSNIMMHVILALCNSLLTRSLISSDLHLSLFLLYFVNENSSKQSQRRSDAHPIIVVQVLHY